MEANAGHGCLVSCGDFDGCAEVAQVIHVESTLGGAHDKSSPVWSKVNGCEWRLYLLIAKDPVEMTQIKSTRY